MDNRSFKQHISTGIKLAALVAIVCFFFPLCTVSCSGEEVDITGMNATLGTEIFDQRVEGSLIFGLLLALPLVSLTSVYGSNKNYYVLSAGSGAAQLFMLRQLKSQVAEAASEAYASSATTWAYTLDIAAAFAIVALSILWLVYRPGNKEGS